ncbi:MAG: GNAT family N-acetyltransferase [Paracoccaceae bacterium]
MKAGARIKYHVTYLEMTGRPGYPRPPMPIGKPTALIVAEDPPVWYFLALYDAVGADYEWTDWHHRPESELRAFIHDPNVTLYTLMSAGWPAGFFVLDAREAGICDLAYFGLVPQATGLGLGTYLLRTAVHAAWDIEGVEKLTVNTNTLDHHRALALYQKAGFVPVRREEHERTLTRDRVTERI